jgi:tetratricopeptide (TPR) repeat protein
MQREVGVVLAFCVVLGVGLSLAPTSVVESKPTEKQKISESPKPQTEQNHQPLAAEDAQKIEKLKSSLSKISDPAGKVAVYADLIKTFYKANSIDSAAIYAEALFRQVPSEANMLQAADTYLDASNFALSAEKTTAMATKARELYQQCLAKNPTLISAKTKLAMTYVSSETPMTGIMLLREVLEQEPNYEPAQMNLGLLSLKSGQIDKALARFKTVYKNNPQNTEAMFYLAISMVEAKEVTEAKKLFNELLKRKIDPAIRQASEEALQNLNK